MDTAQPSLAPPRSRLVINVEMDDRTVLFPDGKFLSHVSLHEPAAGRLRLDAVFHFNESRTDATIASLSVEDGRELVRSILDGVFQGRTQHVLSDETKIAVLFNPNGFILKFGEERALRELFINSPAIIRLAQGIARLVDKITAPAPH